MDEPLKIVIDHSQYINTLSLVSSIAVGGSSPQFLEERVRELQEIIPFLPTVISWMSVALDKVYEAKQGNVDCDPEALKNFLVHDEILCKSQGALAALLCVAEAIKSQYQKSPETKGSSRKKKS